MVRLMIGFKVAVAPVDFSVFFFLLILWPASLFFCTTHYQVYLGLYSVEVLQGSSDQFALIPLTMFGARWGGYSNRAALRQHCIRAE